MNALRRLAQWYWRGLKSVPVFTAGYVTGGIVVGTMTQFPVLARVAISVAERSL